MIDVSGIRALGEACPTSFDETSLLEGDGEGLRREMLQARDWTALEGRSWEPHPTRAKLETKARQNF